MLAVLDEKDLDMDNVFFIDKKRNIVMASGTFMKIAYSTEHMNMMGIAVHYPLIASTRNQFLVLDFTNAHVQKCVESMCKLEEDILNAYLHSFGINKPAAYGLRTSLFLGAAKVHKDESSVANVSFVLKISGVWESASTVGITYKILQLVKV
jgi:hypothetical protein